MAHRLFHTKDEKHVGGQHRSVCVTDKYLCADCTILTIPYIYKKIQYFFADFSGLLMFLSQIHRKGVPYGKIPVCGSEIKRRGGCEEAKQIVVGL